MYHKKAILPWYEYVAVISASIVLKFIVSNESVVSQYLVSTLTVLYEVYYRENNDVHHHVLLRKNIIAQ